MTTTPDATMLEFLDARIDHILARPSLWGPPEGIQGLVLSHLQIRAFHLGERCEGLVTRRQLWRITTMLGHSPLPLWDRLQNIDRVVEVLRVVVKAEREELSSSKKESPIFGEKDRDKLLFARVLAELVEVCPECKLDPSTKVYFYDDGRDPGEGGFAGCCALCLPAIEARCREDFVNFRSHDSKTADLIHRLQKRVRATD